MDNMFLNILFFIAYSLFLYIPTKQAIHMFQQNRYNLPRYMTWLRETIRLKKDSILKLWLCLMPCYGLLIVSQRNLPEVLLLLLVFIFTYICFKVEDHNTYRKPLLFTGRVKRLLLCSYVLYVIVFIALKLFASHDVLIILTPFLFFFPWPFLLVASKCAAPIETYIQERFVQDAKRILQEMDHVKIIGITGSYGKTSVKNILQELLSDDHYSLMTPHSYNNLMGITLSVRTLLKPIHELFLCEMGADHVGEITNLMNFVKPHIGVVTAVGPQHLQTFGSIENILHEKMQMIEKLPSDGIGFLNRDNAYIKNYSIQNTCKIVWYGKDPNATYRLEAITYSKRGSDFHIIHNHQTHHFHTKLLGEHNILNITCAVAIAHSFGVTWAKLERLVTTLTYVEHRLQLLENGRYTILDNAYNSNPEGAAYALAVLSAMEGRRFIVTPGFIDLGKRQESEHVLFGKRIANSADEVCLIGKIQTRAIYQGLMEEGYDPQHIHVYNHIHEAFTYLSKNATKADIVLLENDLPDAFNH